MKIIFVCSANICRSALAEVVLRKKLQERGITSVEVESAGVHKYAGEPRDHMMCSYALKAGYEMGGESKYICPETLDTWDYIICMEHFHVVEIQKLLTYSRWNRIHLFNELCFGEPTSLPDPYGDTDYIYSYVLQQIENGCEVLAKKLEHTISKG